MIDFTKVEFFSSTAFLPNKAEVSPERFAVVEAGTPINGGARWRLIGEFATEREAIERAKKAIGGNFTEISVIHQGKAVKKIWNSTKGARDGKYRVTTHVGTPA